MDTLQLFRNWFAQHQQRLKSDYFQFLRFASISADPSYRKDVLACADWLCSYLKQAGLHSELISTKGYPIVYAELRSEHPSAPTVLIYGHYDVQPIDPLELWTSPPFEPTEREGKIFARGAVDDKGQIFYAVLAAAAYKSLGLSLPVNLKFCIEGEEESQSMGLSHALPSLKNKLSADALLIVDFDSRDDGTPTLTFGARGLTSLEVTLKGSSSDLHSGVLGGLAYNPNRALVELLAGLWDESGTVAVPGFYDGVDEIDSREKDKYAFTLDQKRLSREFGIEAIGAERGRSLQEANWFRPTLELNGIVGGYTGTGIKTVIPAEAHAKISCRLVSRQDPVKVAQAIVDFLKSRVKPGMKLEIKNYGGVGAFQGSPDSFLAKRVAFGAEKATGKRCLSILSGASIPIAAEMKRVLQTEVVGMGYCHSTDNIHAPNEQFDWRRFEMGFLTLAGAFSPL